MKGKRRSFSDKFKAKVAIEAIKGIKTLSELATEYKVHPNQISARKRNLQLCSMRKSDGSGWILGGLKKSYEPAAVNP